MRPHNIITTFRSNFPIDGNPRCYLRRLCESITSKPMILCVNSQDGNTTCFFFLLIYFVGKFMVLYWDFRMSKCDDLFVMMMMMMMTMMIYWWWWFIDDLLMIMTMMQLQHEKKNRTFHLFGSPLKPRAEPIDFIAFQECGFLASSSTQVERAEWFHHQHVKIEVPDGGNVGYKRIVSKVGLISPSMEKVLVPKIEVLTYVRSMDAAYVRESPPKVQYQKIRYLNPLVISKGLKFSPQKLGQWSKLTSIFFKWVESIR